jgi:hypothetical protein
MLTVSLKLLKKVQFLLVPIFLLSTLSVQAATNQKDNNPAMRTIPAPIYGVTIDDISQIAAIKNSLANLPHMPTARIVFDEHMPASYYAPAVKRLHNVSYIMGELLDSSAFSTYNLEAYKKRTAEYLNELDGQVDLWEIGNEVNGEWLGKQADVIKKIMAANTMVKARGGRTALTLYYNLGCSPTKQNEMFVWANAIPDSMRNNLDYVFVSYYPDDCPGPKPNWDEIFAKLHTLFPNSKLGFGEIGTAIDSKKPEFIKQYYGLKVNSPYFVGGYFWWYFRQDMVPAKKPLWSVLSAAFNSQYNQFLG